MLQIQQFSCPKRMTGLLLLVACFPLLTTAARAQPARTLSGIIVTSRQEAIPGATLIIESEGAEQRTTTDEEGRFSLRVPSGVVRIRVAGQMVQPIERTIAAGERSTNLRIVVETEIPPIHDSLVISATQLDPAIDRRNGAIYRNQLFSRDDQIFHTIDAGINAGQHEGGGKSLEIRRFGFNSDHGGVSGGLKVLVDNFQQNQGTQGHGQGYLGQLKSLTPELVDEVEIINGPFSAEYGDFSGLGVVHIRQRESFPDQLTARLQGGSFSGFRSFLAYSPAWRKAPSLIAYESSRTDGPFLNPLGYRRDNVTANLTRKIGDHGAAGLKFNFGRNDFRSSGQIPLDEVEAGELDRFGFIDPDNGGRVRTGMVGGYFRRENRRGGVFKLDGYLSRSLFDLYSNFTFFLHDEVNGDEIRQHDSRLQEGANAQYLQPFRLRGQRALLRVGANYHDNRIQVGLDRTIARTPSEATTKARARVSNLAGYVQQELDLWGSRLRLEGGLRYDLFNFRVEDQIDQSASGLVSASRFQPKFSLALTPISSWPMTFYVNYGRGITSQDARGVVQRPDGPQISTTEFYQAGFAQNFSRFSASIDLFLIDRSHEQVYLPDGGSFEFKGPSRSSGYEIKTSFRITRRLSLNGGVTQVMNAFYRGTSPRLYLDSAPHTVANAGLTLSDWRGISGSLRYRHIGNYRLDGEDQAVRASGFDLIDLSLTRRINRRFDLNFAIDNLTSKRYYETQNYFESRRRPSAASIARIHATPGYPITVTAGLSFRINGKD